MAMSPISLLHLRIAVTSLIIAALSHQICFAQQPTSAEPVSLLPTPENPWVSAPRPKVEPVQTPAAAETPAPIKATIIKGYTPPTAKITGTETAQEVTPLEVKENPKPLAPAEKDEPDVAALLAEAEKVIQAESEAKTDANEEKSEIQLAAPVKSGPGHEKVQPLVVDSSAGLIDIGKNQPKPVAEVKSVAKPEVKVAKSSAAPKSATSSGTRSSWRNRYELGPGDALNFALHGQPKLKKLAVPVAPDGTISYLQAKQIDVRGKTIDELRNAMNAVLKPYHGDSKLIITPAALGSKRYTVLGEVRANGSYPLERPTTLLNALAKSGGFNLGSSGESAIELADLRRSFVVRGGQRMPVDMEALYFKGDMKHNVQVEPGDYIYIASRLRNEIYVFGSVNAPGVKPMESGFTTLGAIAAAGDFTQKAWKDRVLVIRGRLDQPETKIAHLKQVLQGKETDFQLEPGDIVYVHDRPWAFAERLIDTAIVAYIDGSVAGWVAEGTNISVSAGR